MQQQADNPPRLENFPISFFAMVMGFAGLTIAYRAYQMSLDGEEAPVIDGLTGDQRFFLGWAQVWRSKSRDEEAKRRLTTDPHSPAKFRANGAAVNIDAFYTAFEVAEGDGMYLPPEERVKIW